MAFWNFWKKKKSDGTEEETSEAVDLQEETASLETEEAPSQNESAGNEDDLGREEADQKDVQSDADLLLEAEEVKTETQQEKVEAEAVIAQASMAQTNIEEVTMIEAAGKESPEEKAEERNKPETEGKETEGKETEGKETEGKETEGKETEGEETEGTETEGKEIQEKETEGKETEGKETEGKETEGKETEEKETEEKETQEKGIEGKESEGEETEKNESEVSGNDSEVPAEKKKGFFARLKEGLSKTRANIVKGIDNLFSGFSSIDEDFYEELEEILIMGDIGVNATGNIIEKLRQQVKEEHIKNPAECKSFLIENIKEQMQVGDTAYEFEKKQSVIMVIGVNGVGKTTTVGKLAWKLKDDGRKVLIAAADTFRAAAGDQLAKWAERAGVPMIGGREGADPASVVFDAVSAAKARGVDILLIDTAGRLHNKKNLMEELRKMNRIIDKEFPNCHRENLIVLDGTTGQNALAQAREFGDVADLTGIVLTKMDGTAKGGIAVAIQSELNIPVKYIGVGETTQDLQKFDPNEFVNALFEVEGEENDGQEE